MAKIRRHKVGDIIRASWLNNVAEAVERLDKQSFGHGMSGFIDSTGVATSAPPQTKLLYVELLQDIKPSTAAVLDGASSTSDDVPIAHAQAAVLIWNATTQQWVRNGTQQIEVATDVYGYTQLVLDRGARLVVWFYRQASKWLPFLQGNTRIAVTVADAAGNYPREDQQPIFPIAFCDGSFMAQITDESPAINPKNGGPHAYAYNLADVHIDEGELLQVFWQQDAWWTHWCCGTAEVASSAPASSSSKSTSSTSSVSASSTSSSSSVSISLSSLSSASSLSVSSSSSTSSESSSSDSSDSSASSASSASSSSSSSTSSYSSSSSTPSSGSSSSSTSLSSLSSASSASSLSSPSSASSASSLSTNTSSSESSFDQKSESSISESSQSESEQSESAISNSSQSESWGSSQSESEQSESSRSNSSRSESSISESSRSETSGSSKSESSASESTAFSWSSISESSVSNSSQSESWGSSQSESEQSESGVSESSMSVSQSKSSYSESSQSTVCPPCDEGVWIDVLVDVEIECVDGEIVMNKTFKRVCVLNVCDEYPG